MAEAALGIDPAAAKQAARTHEEETFAALVKEFEKFASRRKGWLAEKQIIYAQLMPLWRTRPVREITRREVRSLVETKALTAPVMANRLLAEVSRLFNFGVDREWLDASPAHRMKRPGVETSRDRVLRTNELNELWAALGETSAEDDGDPRPRLTATLNDAFKVLLLTAQRVGEVCSMRWTDVDLEKGWWNLPGSATKNGADHRVPLTDTVAELLARRLQTAKGDAVFVFSTRKGTNVSARAKKAASHLSRGLSFSFRAHDLRRTAASGMAEAGISRDHVGQVLNHRSVTHRSITAVYDRYSYDREKRSALEMWERTLLRIVSGTATNGGRIVAFGAHA